MESDAIPRCVCVCACVCARMHACTSTHASHSVVSDSWTPHESCLIRATPWTVARQAPVSMEFSRQEYWSGLPLSSPGDLPDPGMETGLLHCKQILYHRSHQGSRKRQPIYRQSLESLYPMSSISCTSCCHQTTSFPSSMLGMPESPSPPSSLCTFQKASHTSWPPDFLLSAS